MTKLIAPPQELVTALSTEQGVATADVASFSTRLSGLTEAEALNMLDDLSFRRSWNMETRMAAAEIVDYARPPA